MIFYPTHVVTTPQTSWIQLLLHGASSLHRGLPTPISHLSPRMLEDIGYYRSPEVPPRRRR